MFPVIQSFPDNAADESTSTHIFNDIGGMTSAHYRLPNSPAAEVLQDVEIVELSEFIATLNSTAPFDVDPTHTELADSFLQPMFDESRDPTARYNEISQD